jgi:catechol 2,3-dioxygenase-like lactoylglutathione lyase family enzyme
MQIKLASVMVDDQDKALRFYTTILGFVKTYQKALFDAGIPATAFRTRDIHAEYRRLKSLGVGFRGEPNSMGPITAVLFEDTCGNLVNLVQPPA